jgi:hypothetical protein
LFDQQMNYFTHIDYRHAAGAAYEPTNFYIDGAVKGWRSKDEMPADGVIAAHPPWTSARPAQGD